MGFDRPPVGEGSGDLGKLTIDVNRGLPRNGFILLTLAIKAIEGPEYRRSSVR